MPGDDYEGWSIIKSHHAAEKELHPDMSASQKQRDNHVYHKAIMADILECRMYRESEMRRLFQYYLEKAPIREKEVVEQVLRDLREKFDVR